MRYLLPFALLTPALLLLTARGSARQDEPKPEQPRPEQVKPGQAKPEQALRNLIDLDPAERQALQVRAMELAQPSEEHARLTSYAGTFDAEVKMWIAPGQPPLESKAVMTHESVVGGRFLRISGSTTFTFPGMGEYSVESLQYLGFDRRSGEYTSVGFDSMGTYSTEARGTFDEATSTATLSGVTEDPSLGIRQAYDTVIEFVDADTLKMTTIVYDAFQPGPFKLMEVTSRRHNW